MAGWFGKKRGIATLILSNLLVAGLAFLAARWPAPGGVEILPPPPTATAQPTFTPAPVRVYVSGAVKSPGVYTLPPHSIAQDALLAAGGATDDADLSRVNLAAPLEEGQQVNVPREGQPASRNSPAPTPTVTCPVNVNTATAVQLESLPGIGPAIAERIIKYRQEHGPFRTVDALLEVPGIGEATLEKIRGCVAVQ